MGAAALFFIFRGERLGPSTQARWRLGRNECFRLAFAQDDGGLKRAVFLLTGGGDGVAGAWAFPAGLFLRGA